MTYVGVIERDHYFNAVPFYYTAAERFGDVPEPTRYPYGLNAAESDVAGIQVALHRTASVTAELKVDSNRTGQAQAGCLRPDQNTMFQEVY